MQNCTDHELVRILNQKLEECEECKNRNTKGGPLLTENSNYIDLMFIAQNPGKSWYDANVSPSDIVPFGLQKKNPYNSFFFQFIDEFKRIYNREPIFYITNIIKCATKDNKVEDQDQIDTCVNRFLLKEIQFFQNHNSNLLIVSLGKPSREVLRNRTDITSRVTYFHHPGYMNRQGNEYKKEKVSQLIGEL